MQADSKRSAAFENVFHSRCSRGNPAYTTPNEGGGKKAAAAKAKAKAAAQPSKTVKKKETAKRYNMLDLSPTVDDMSKAKGQRAGGAKPKSKLSLSKTAVDDDDASFDLDFGTGYKVQRATAATHKLPPATQAPETDEDDTPLTRPKPAVVNKAKFPVSVPLQPFGLGLVRPLF
jgi:hypothetical protein